MRAGVQGTLTTKGDDDEKWLRTEDNMGSY